MGKYIEKLYKLAKEYKTLKNRDIIIVQDKDAILTEEENQKAKEEQIEIICDKQKWKVPKEMKSLVDQIREDTSIKDEYKLLIIYQKVCTAFTYDDNVLSYLKRDNEMFELPDWYGLDPKKQWNKNRKEHNYRVCYEVSRYLVAALNDVFENRNDVNICILWDKANTHYFVGFVSDDYMLTLDTDDFEQIKDLTRLKTGLSLQGINILKDKDGNFKKCLDIFNSHKEQHSKNKIDNIIKSNIEKAEQFLQENDNKISPVHKNKSLENIKTDTKVQTTSNIPKINISVKDDKEIPKEIKYLGKVVTILKYKYHLDDPGIFEYLKEIVDTNFGSQCRRFVWKDIGNGRFSKCLIFAKEDSQFIVDSWKNNIFQVSDNDIDASNEYFNPKKLNRDDIYDGR